MGTFGKIPISPGRVLQATDRGPGLDSVNDEPEASGEEAAATKASSSSSRLASSSSTPGSSSIACLHLRFRGECRDVSGIEVELGGSIRHGFVDFRVADGARVAELLPSSVDAIDSHEGDRGCPGSLRDRACQLLHLDESSLTRQKSKATSTAAAGMADIEVPNAATTPNAATAAGADHQ